MNNLYKTIYIVIVLCWSAVLGLSQNGDNREWDKLPTDDKYIIGKLENGLTYYIRESKSTEGRADFYIIHNVGSLQENDNQRGLAHFLEHMAFNGTKNFPDKGLLEYFASIGVKFGNNINAYTSMDRTVYNISAVPVDKRETIIDSALLAIHDWSHYINCNMEEIDKERGVVREEWRRGDEPRTRMFKGVNMAIQKGSRFAQRDVIGVMDIIDTFSRETLIDYYHKWYRPDLQAVVVIGDIDASDIEQRIKSRFSQIPAKKDGAEREVYSIPGNKEPHIVFITDPESQATNVKYVVKIPLRSQQERQTSLALYDKVLQDMIQELMRVRLDAAAKDKNAGFRRVVPIFGSISYAIETFAFTAMPKDSKNTADALRDIAIEIERVKQHRFSEQELEIARKSAKANLTKNYNRSKDVKNADYVSAAVEHFTRQSPLVTVDSSYEISKRVLDNITLEDLNSSVDRFLTDSNLVVIFFTNESLKSHLPSKEEVEKILLSAKETKHEPFQSEGVKVIPIPVIKSTGAIISEKILSAKDIGIKDGKELKDAVEWKLENGIKVIWKSDPEADNLIRMSAFRDGGYSRDLSLDKIKTLQSFILLYSVADLDNKELARWSSNNSVSVRPDIDYRTEGFKGSFTPKQAQNFFSLLHLYFTDANLSVKAVSDRKTLLKRDINTQVRHRSIYNDSVVALRFSHYPLNIKLTNEDVERVDRDELIALFNDIFTGADNYTFVFSGSMEPIKAKEYIEKYVATIPKSVTNKGKIGDYKEPIMRRGDVSLIYTPSDVTSTKASVNVLYHSNSKSGVEENLLVKFATYILRDRYMQSIREDKGGTYYVGVTGNIIKEPVSKGSKEKRDVALFSIDFDTESALVDDLLAIVHKEIEVLIKDGPTQKEIDEIKLYLSKVYKDRKQNIEWVSVITNSLQGIENYDIEKESEILDSITVKKVHQFVKDVLKTKNQMVFVFKPM